MNGAKVVAVAAITVVVVVALTPRDERLADIPPEAVRWYGAMELYRSLALWAGKRAMSAEIEYWKAAQA
jgi:hypothetical protein